MGGKKKVPKAETLSTVPVRMGRELARKARMIATDRGVDLSAYLNALLAGPIGTDYSALRAKLVAEIEQG